MWERGHNDGPTRKRENKMKQIALFILLLCLMLSSQAAFADLSVVCSSTSPSDNGIIPMTVAGNPDLCEGGKRIDPPASGTFSLDGIPGAWPADLELGNWDLQS